MTDRRIAMPVPARHTPRTRLPIGRTPGAQPVAALAILLLSIAGSARAQSVFELHTIGPGIIAAEVVRNPPAYAFANSLIVIGNDGVLVVDSQQSTTAARALIAEIARITAAPVRWVVNTHWHADHVNGNQAYAAAFPDVEFIAHSSVAADLKTLGAAAREKELAELPVSIEARQTWLTTGIGPDGAVLSDSARDGVARSLRLRQAYLEELRGIVPVPPTRTFDERLDLHEDVSIRANRTTRQALPRMCAPAASLQRPTTGRQLTRRASGFESQPSTRARRRQSVSGALLLAVRR